jgi:BirA family biotin operon repressor/biotin-[acetyl-CoA-carboxylase] ligase
MKKDRNIRMENSLAGLTLGEICYYRKIGSTNDVAMQRGADGAPDMSIYIAEQQTAGRGRLERKWVTNPQAALAFTLLIRPTKSEQAYLPLFSPWGGVALCQALETAGLRPQIKWPNDVLIDRKKVAGILLETSWSGDELHHLVVGIGVNVAPGALPPTDQLRFPATSLESEFGGPLDRWIVLREILAKLLAWRSRLGTPEFRTAWEERLAFRGEMVRVGTGLDEGRLGQVQGVDDVGNLILLDTAGQRFTIQVGEVSLRPIP